MAYTVGDSARIVGRSGAEGGLGALAGGGGGMLATAALLMALKNLKVHPSVLKNLVLPAGTAATMGGSGAGGLIGATHGFTNAMHNADQRHIPPGLIQILKQKLGVS